MQKHLKMMDFSMVAKICKFLLLLIKHWEIRGLGLVGQICKFLQQLIFRQISRALLRRRPCENHENPLGKSTFLRDPHCALWMPPKSCKTNFNKLTL